MLLIMLGETSLFTAEPSSQVRLITLDPGHFHAGLVQKFMYPQVSPTVYVYAPEGPDLQEHLKRIETFNARNQNPTRWQEKVYAGPDFLERLIREKPGNLVVISGNNARKAEYIHRAVDAGLHVLADKPMAITPAGFELLRKAFELAAAKKVLLYDIMTERHEITLILQRELARLPQLFGTLEPGAPERPAVVMESLHYFYKEVAGTPLMRPAWFFDVRQAGEAIPDVGTHLVDLVQWECFPEQALDWQKDIRVLSARRWPTTLNLREFQRVTGLNRFPNYLDLTDDGLLNVYQNGDVDYTVRGVHAKVTALWKFEATPGARDTLYTLLRGTKANLAIKQGPEQHYQPTLYVEDRSVVPRAEFERRLRAAVKRLSASWPGLGMKLAGTVCEIVIPEQYRVGHEAHFAQVTEDYLRFIAEGQLPSQEVPNMLAKYFVTTEAYRLSHQPK